MNSVRSKLAFNSAWFQLNFKNFAERTEKREIRDSTAHRGRAAQWIKKIIILKMKTFIWVLCTCPSGVSTCGHMDHDKHAEVRGQPCGVGSHRPPRGCWGLNSDLQPCTASPLPTEPSCQPNAIYLTVIKYKTLFSGCLGEMIS